MNPEGGDECIKEVGDGVLWLKVKCLAARDEGYGGEGKEGDDGGGRKWLVEWGCGWRAEDSNLEVFGIGDDGVVAELNGNPVDGYECRRKR